MVHLSQDSFYRELNPLEISKANKGMFNFDHPDAQLAVDSFNEYGNLWVNGTLPAWYYYVDTSVRLIPLVKKMPLVATDVPDVRPVGVGNNMRRAI